MIILIDWKLHFIKFQSQSRRSTTIYYTLSTDRPKHCCSRSDNDDDKNNHFRLMYFVTCASADVCCCKR